MKKEGRIRTFKEFYSLIEKIRNEKKRLVKKVLNNKKIPERDIKFLKNAKSLIKKIPKEKEEFVLLTPRKDKIKVRLDYEIQELEKDIIYLEKGEEALMKYFSKIHKNFYKQVNSVSKFLKDKKINSLITDRDGTINNYCGRYKSSIQSVYNSVFLKRFSDSIEKSVIFTSAPLKSLLEVITLPRDGLVYSGSKGREIKSSEEGLKKLELEKEKLKYLRKLERKIKKLLKQKKYNKFYYIGSGFQLKHGEISLGKQDSFNSVPEELSKEFFNKIKSLVREIDPEKKIFSIVDIGLDIEITLNTKKGKEFDKGNGLRFVLDKVKGTSSPYLICGDTESDIPLLKTSRKLNKNFISIFVTNNQKLKNSVKKYSESCQFVTSPDILVSALNKVSKENEI